jgi:hypothetical protein
MDKPQTHHVDRIPGINEFVTIRSQAISFKKERQGRLINKNDKGMGIVFPADNDSEIETIEKGNDYEINLHFSGQSIDESLEPFIRRGEGLNVFTFTGVCKHVTRHGDGNSLMAGFEITGDIPTPFQAFLKKRISQEKESPVFKMSAAEVRGSV